MSNEVKLEDAKPGMWAEFDVKDSERFDPGHYLLELVPPPDPEGVEDLMYLNLCRMIFEVDPMKALGVMVRGNTVPILDDKREPFRDVENLHVYEEKPEPPTSDTDVPEGFTAIGTIKVMPGDAHDLANIPTEPGLYRAATGSIWYYDGKSWTPITDHNGEYMYAQKQSYKRFIETSLASHRCPFTPISLTGTEVNDPEDELPTEPGWYEDKEGAIYRFDGYFWKMLDISYITYGSDELRKYMPFKPIDDIELYVKKEIHGQA